MQTKNTTPDFINQSVMLFYTLSPALSFLNLSIILVSQATAKRDAAAKALFDWLAEYKQFARTQFKDQPAVAQRLLL